MKLLWSLVVACAAVPAPATARQRAVASHEPARAAAARPSEAARVNATALTSDRLDAAVNALIPQESFHRHVAPDKLAELRARALQGLIDDELQYQDAVNRGLSVSPAAVTAALRRAEQKYPNAQAFSEALRRAGATRGTVRREIRRSLLIDKARARTVDARCRVSAAEAERYFNANAGRFLVPEQLHLFNITVGVDPGASAAEWAAAKLRAEEVLAQARAGAPFDDLARRHSSDPSRTSGGDMGLVHRGSLAPEFEEATRGATAGEVRGVVKTIYGFHVVRIADILPPRQQTFEQARTGIIKDLSASRCADAKAAWLARLRGAAVIRVAPAP